MWPRQRKLLDDFNKDFRKNNKNNENNEKHATRKTNRQKTAIHVAQTTKIAARFPEDFRRTMTNNNEQRKQ